MRTLPRPPASYPCPQDKGCSWKHLRRHRLPKMCPQGRAWASSRRQDSKSRAGSSRRWNRWSPKGSKNQGRRLYSRVDSSRRLRSLCRSPRGKGSTRCCRCSLKRYLENSTRSGMRRAPQQTALGGSLRAARRRPRTRCPHCKAPPWSLRFPAGRKSPVGRCTERRRSRRARPQRSPPGTRCSSSRRSPLLGTPARKVCTRRRLLRPAQRTRCRQGSWFPQRRPGRDKRRPWGMPRTPQRPLRARTSQSHKARSWRERRRRARGGPSPAGRGRGRQPRPRRSPRQGRAPLMR